MAIPKTRPKKKAPAKKKTRAKSPPKNKTVTQKKSDGLKKKPTAPPTSRSQNDVFEKAKKEDKPRASALSVLDNMDAPETKDTKGAESGDKKPEEAKDAKGAESGDKKPEESKDAKGAESGDKKPEEAKDAKGAESADNKTEEAKDAKVAESADNKTEEAKDAKGAESADNKTEDSKEASKAKLPEGVTMEQATKVAQQIQDFANLATHLPGILKMGDEIKAGGIQAKHTEALKAAYGPMKGLLTPENIQAFKDLDTSKVEKLLSKENLDMLKATNPKLAESLNSEKITKLKEGLEQAQGFLDKNKLARNMSMMAPFVKTSAGEGALNMVGRMVDDPNQLGGADGQLSLTDMGQVTHGLLNTGPVRGIVNGKIAGGINHAVNYRKNGQQRTRLGKRVLGNLTSRPKIRQKIYNEAWSQVRQKAPGMVRQQAAPYLSSNGSSQDRNIPRRFNDNDIQHLMNVGKQVQGMRGQTGSSGMAQVDNANQAMAGMTGILHKSVIGDDGMISGQELRNVSGFGTQLYNYMGLLYTGVGGQYR